MNSYGFVNGSQTGAAPVARPLPRKPWWSQIWVWCIIGLCLLVGAAVVRFFVKMSSAGTQSDTAVAKFHERLNAEQYAEIYSESDDLFKNAGSEEEMLKFFKMVHQRVGNETDTKRLTFGINKTFQGTFVRATYQSEFDTGPASETFTWRVAEPEYVLVGYNVNSKALLKLE